MGKIENGLNAVENFLSTTQEMQDTAQEIYDAARDTYDTVQNTTNTFNHVVDYNTSEDWKEEMTKYDRLIERCKKITITLCTLFIVATILICIFV